MASKKLHVAFQLSPSLRRNVALAKRATSNLILLEGKRAVFDALRLTVENASYRNLVSSQVVFPKPLYLAYSDAVVAEELRARINFSSNNAASLHFLTEAQMKQVSDLDSPPNMLGVFQIQPCQSVEQKKDDGWPRISLVCDRIADPTNMGNLLRNAAAFALHRVILLKGCAHPWKPKTLRAAMGGHFQVAIISNSTSEELCNCQRKRCYVAVADDKAKSYLHVDYFSQQTSELCRQQEIMLIVGSEAHGVDRQLINDLTRYHDVEQITIPMHRVAVESLNCATAVAILLAEIRRQWLLLTNEFD